MSFLFGTSKNGLAMTAYQFGTPTTFGHRKLTKNPGKHLLLLAGVHGDEHEGVFLARALLNLLFKKDLNDTFNFRLTIVPEFNIDGILAKTRGNSSGVDLNRNLPTKDWSEEATSPRYQPGPAPASEPENQALISFIENQAPDFIISLHSWNPLLNINEPEGSTICQKVASSIASITGDKIEPTIGYSTPGCLGTYAGFERDIPTITYEIQRGLESSEVIKLHLPALITGLTTYANL